MEQASQTSGLMWFPSRIDDHLGNFMTKGVSVNFFVGLIVDRVVIVGNGQVFIEYQTIAVGCPITGTLIHIRPYVPGSFDCWAVNDCA